MHTKGQELELKLEQFQIGKGSVLENQTIISSELRQKTGVIVIAIKRNGMFMTNPSPDTVLKEGAHLITLGAGSEFAKFEELIRQK